MSKWVQQAVNMWSLDLLNERLYLSEICGVRAYTVELQSSVRENTSRTFMAKSLDEAKEKALQFAIRECIKVKSIMEQNLNTLYAEISESEDFKCENSILVYSSTK